MAAENSASRTVLFKSERQPPDVQLHVSTGYRDVPVRVTGSSCFVGWRSVGRLAGLIVFVYISVYCSCNLRSPRGYRPVPVR